MIITQSSVMELAAEAFIYNQLTQMKFKALRYGEFFQGKISVYNHKRPLFVSFLECIEKESQKWVVDFYPRNALVSGMVLSLDPGEQNVLCEIVGRKGAVRYVRLLNPDIDLAGLWERKMRDFAEA